MMKKLLTPRWLIGHVLVVLAVIVLINLGLWQLRRLDQRRALNASILAGLNAPVVVLSGQTVDPQELNRHRVSATGTFDNQAAVALRNRPFQGQPGVHLVTPLKIKGSDKAVLASTNVTFATWLIGVGFPWRTLSRKNGANTARPARSPSTASPTLASPAQKVFWCPPTLPPPPVRLAWTPGSG